MTGAVRSVAIVVVAAALVSSGPLGYVGIGAGTTVSTAETADSSAVYPGQTVSVVNVSVSSEDEVISEQVEPQQYIGKSSSRFSGPTSQNPDLFLDSGSDPDKFDMGDAIARLKMLSNGDQSQVTHGKISHFANDVYYIDSNYDLTYSWREPIVEDGMNDGKVDTSDKILYNGTQPIQQFQYTDLNEVYIDSDTNGKFGISDPVFSTDTLGQLSRGALDNGNTKLLREGQGNINGFDSVNGDVNYIDSVNEGSPLEYDDGEAIISENGNGEFERGNLTSGDKIIRSGTANLEAPEQNRIFYIDELEGGKDEYNPSEAIIKDTGVKVGELDSKDEIIFSGEGHVSDFEISSSTFGTGDIYIGNSSNAEFDDSEFIYVESSGNGRYDVGEDIVLAGTGSDLASRDTTKVTLVTDNKFTNIGYLDLNGNGKIDAKSNEKSFPGVEPIVEFVVPSDSLSSKEIDGNTVIVTPYGDDPTVKNVDGTLLSGSKYQDITNGVGPYSNGKIFYSDTKSGDIGELDSGEILVEKVEGTNTLTEADYIIRSGNVKDFQSEYIRNKIEFIDVNTDEKFTDADYIIESSTPDNQDFDISDEIISSGSENLGTLIESEFEFIDTNQNGKYDLNEVILKSSVAGDKTVNTNDEIFMSTNAPGDLRLAPFQEQQFGESFDEIYVDTSKQNGVIDPSEVISRFSILHSGSFEGSIEGHSMHQFSDEIAYIDKDDTSTYSDGDFIYREYDGTNLETKYGNTLTALTVRNEGTTPDDAIASVSLRRNGTEIARTSTREDGVWTLEPTDSVAFGPDGATFEVAATLAADAPPDTTVDMSIPGVTDGGTAGEFDQGDRGLFFADGPPAGHLGSGPTYTVADPDDIDATGIAYPDPSSDDPESGAIELAFTDALDPTTTAVDDFTVETLHGENVNVTGVGDDDDDERLVLSVEGAGVPSSIATVHVEAGALSVASGAAVPERTVDVTTTGVTITEAEARPHVVYDGERVAVVANDGANGTPNSDEKLRIEGDTTGDGEVDDLHRLGATGAGSLVGVVDTAEDNASTYRVAFESEDGSPGETVEFPVRNLSLGVTANRTNTTDVAGPIGASVAPSGSDRAIHARLLDRDADNETVLDEQVVTLDGEGEGTVAFPARVANVSIAVRDLATGQTNRTETITVRKGYPGATFASDVVEEHRGDVARIEVRLVDTTNATITIGEAAVNYRETVSVADADGDGRATVTLNTHRAGASAAGTGVGLRTDRQAETVDRIVSVDRAFPPGKGLGEPLDVGSYPLEAVVDGEVTDVAELRVENRSTSGATTLVAPAGVDLEDASDVRNWTTPRETVAVGDQAIVAVNASGLGGFLNESPDLRRKAAAAAENGAYVSVERGNPPPNRPARHLNVSNASTLVDRGEDSLYVVVPSGGDPYSIEAGEEFDAKFVLNETSPYVGGSGSPDTVERESAETSVVFEQPTGRFADLDANETIDLPATADASITGQTNVAPGTNVTVSVVSDDENVTFRESDTEQVEEDGTFDSDVDLESYPEGTEYTVVASANGDDITAVRTGQIVEAAIETDAAQTVAGVSGGGGGGSQPRDDGDETEPTVTETRTPTTESGGEESVGERAAEFVTRDVPQFITTQATKIVVGLGIVAVLYGLVGLRRLTR